MVDMRSLEYSLGLSSAAPLSPEGWNSVRLDKVISRISSQVISGSPRKETHDPAYLREVWWSIPTEQTYTCLHSFVSSCLYMLFNFLFSYREYEDLL